MSKDYVYVFVCPVCGKRIVGVSLSQVKYNALLHINKHKLPFSIEIEKHVITREID